MSTCPAETCYTMGARYNTPYYLRTPCPREMVDYPRLPSSEMLPARVFEAKIQVTQ